MHRILINDDTDEDMPSLMMQASGMILTATVMATELMATDLMHFLTTQPNGDSDGWL